ncbi:MULTISPECIES: CRISPR-associated endonuclease Cas2 [Thermomonospora]|uniref:CRISPR-associated endoribonuclease Cas2 n=1 Tax=Thermomonospora curvata (strain ATCC 19995 / DSM 43183 / JCM 3096 / KCTC 9072 / NBRC 15933 / NCIMB 10081 / Henssen B9) TaxID=471852 RepID=D1A6P9_THECD|nr:MULTISPECIES: CRISPR-associated endonuclease Cas2 [Thermomonospora]ACY96524.1 CRISPR-associated protein Cas2 [Thermomonospora curvata DSM 43183]PKK15537.1 MAG: CRISPR-associated endonuclease Cas2 [Thermomonospora sp. CIF 1]
MFVIVVYDTLAERNPRVLRTCRRYLHWVQRSVFQGELSAAQHRTFISEIKQHIDPGYDSVLIYRTRTPHHIETQTLGQTLGNTDPVL